MIGINQTLREKLLNDARAHCRRTGVSLAALGYKVVGNTHLFERIENGGDVTTRTYEQFQSYFDESFVAGGAPTPPRGAVESIPGGAATGFIQYFFAFTKTCVRFFRNHKVS